MAGMPSPDLLDDLCSRFILNVPPEELESPEKLMFIVETAHWFYEDFCRDQDPTLRSLSLKQFAATLLAHCPPELLPAYAADAAADRGGAALAALSAAFSAFKATVPTAGVILLDPTLTKVLLVRGLKEGASWGFPRGKLARGEGDLDCAVREALEETGFDAGAAIASPSDYIEVHDRQQRSRLYIAPGVDEATPFAPLVRGEIGGLAWHLLADLPATREAASLVYTTADGVRHRFFKVWPYVRPLRQWVKGYRARVKAAGGRLPTASAAGPGAAESGGKKGRRKGRAAEVDKAGAPSAAAPEGRRAAAPAVTAGHLTATSTLPGQAWMTWTGFDRARVMACLKE